MRLGQELSGSVLAELLGGVNSDTFRNVFALGLPELQEVSTLGADEVAEFVYQVSLGPTGRRLLAAHREAVRRQSRYLDAEQTEGSIVVLARQIRQFDEQIGACEEDAGRHTAINQELHRIEAELQDQKRRQHGLRSQLKGHEFMERIAGPWNQKQQLEAELELLPRVAVIPDGGLERLDEMDREIHKLDDRKQTLSDEARRLETAVAGFSADRRLAEQATGIRGLLQRRNAYVETQSRLSTLDIDCEQAREAAEASVSALGDGWNQQRVENIDDTPAAAINLFRNAAGYRKLRTRRARDVRRYQHLASRLQQQQIELAQRLKPLNAADVTEARQSCAIDLELLQTIVTREMRAESLQQTRDELAAESAAQVESKLLPPYFFAVLAAFGILGLVLLIAGVFSVLQGTTGHTPWLVGMIFMLMGTACGGLTWTVKRHFDPDGKRDQSLAERLQSATDELAKLRREIARDRGAIRVTDLLETASRTESDWNAEESLEAARARLVELDRLVGDEESIGKRRVFLSRFRERIRQTQRSVSTARHGWCQALNAAGLEESVRIDAPLEQWRQAAEAKRLWDQQQLISDELQRAEQSVADFRDSVIKLSTRIDGQDHPCDDIGAVLADWEQRLTRSDALRQQRDELDQQSQQQRRAAEHTADQASELRRQRLEHLAEAGATDREEFRDRVRSLARRLELEGELKAADEQLNAAVQSEPELAVVEEDLRAFQASANRSAIAAIRDELTDLSGDLEANREQLGRLRQERSQLEDDRRLTSLRFDRAQSQHQLAEELEDLCAIEIAIRALDHARLQLESTHQPQTLASAGKFLSRLTRGRYGRVWTRLGERQLLVDEEGCGSLDVERLSAGAREQLFLAIRLALTARLRERGVQLPVVLDDVLVNFDEDRTEAAITTLRDVAASGQQILIFTCHQHLAERFSRAGVSTVQLPVRAPDLAQRRVG